MKTWIKIALGGSAVILAGGAVFFATRSAAAQESAAKAFEVSADCRTVRVIDEEAAVAAIKNAALVTFRGLDEPANDLMLRTIKFLTKCEPTDDMLIVNSPAGVNMTVGQAKAIIGDKTVGQVMEQAALREQSFDLNGVGLEGAAAPSPVDNFVGWYRGAT